MSQKSTTAINHAMTAASAVSMVGRAPLFGGASFFAMIVVWFEAFRGVHMDYNWFYGTDKAVIYIAFIVGILFALLVTYILAFEDYKKRKDNALVQFDLRYIVSFIISGVLAGFVAYYIIFFGIDMFYTPKITEYVWDEELAQFIPVAFAQFETFLVVVICFAVGAITAYVIDALVCHKVMDGTLTALNNQAKKKIQMQGELFIKDPAVQAQIKAKAQALGLTDETLIQKLGVVVSGADDPSFATTVQILKAQQK